MKQRTIKTKKLLKVANDNGTKKSEHVITAEISVEIPEKETSQKRTKKYEHWGVMALLSFVVWGGCMVYCACNNQSVNGILALIGSSALFFYSIGQLSFLSSDERIGNTL